MKISSEISRWQLAARWSIGAGLVVLLAGAGLATTTGAAVAAPGNNGTVKIASEGDIDEIPDNEPHQNCIFTVQWYNYEKGDDIIGHVTFELQEPTKGPGYSMVVNGPSDVFVGDDNAGGAGKDLDGEAVYTLDFTGDPQPQQGYHVKLTVDTPHSKGADKKHKVFWVLPCGGPTETPTEPTETPTEPTETPTEPTETPTEPTETPTEPTETPTVSPSESESPSESVSVKPTESERPSEDPTVKGTESIAPTAVDAGIGGGGPTGGGSSPLSGWLYLAGAALMGAGLLGSIAGGYRGKHQV